MKYHVFYSITTKESAERGEHDEAGEIGEFDNLRDAIDAVTRTRTNAVSSYDTGVSDSPTAPDSWIYVYNGMEFETGAYESRALHFPDHVTPASRERVLKLLMK